MRGILLDLCPRFFRARVKVLEHLSIGFRGFAPHGDQPVTVFAGNSGAVRAAEKAGFDSDRCQRSIFTPCDGYQRHAVGRVGAVLSRYETKGLLIGTGVPLQSK